MLEGLPPNRAAYTMRLLCDEATARKVADIIVETFDPATTAAASFATGDESVWAVEAFFGTLPDEAAVRALIKAAASEEAVESAIFGEVAERDWIAASLALLPPVRAGRIFVHGGHDRDRVATNDIGIEIEAALAFGTGHHGSTRGCLLMLADIARRRRPVSILDLGTGSGVLAIAAARLFKREVRAGDIDPVSVRTAVSNAKRNHAGNFIKLALARGVAHPLLRDGAPYDLVMANILARPLCSLAPELARLTSVGAEIILSGLLPRDVAAVLSAYRGQGTALARRFDVDGWVTLLVRRRGRF
ncbi:MAG TPA: 50S ribosomal protein L11 methyltransferase [Methylocella sp.]|nr:50S ribosomal protein L11 methyltransferase [Methylocella sp.]